MGRGAEFKQVISPLQVRISWLVREQIKFDLWLCLKRLAFLPGLIMKRCQEVFPVWLIRKLVCIQAWLLLHGFIGYSMRLVANMADPKSGCWVGLKTQTSAIQRSLQIGVRSLVVSLSILSRRAYRLQTLKTICDSNHFICQILEFFLVFWVTNFFLKQLLS